MSSAFIEDDCCQAHTDTLHLCFSRYLDHIVGSCFFGACPSIFRAAPSPLLLSGERLAHRHQLGSDVGTLRLRLDGGLACEAPSSSQR